MAIQNYGFTYTRQALEDLDTHQYQAIALDDGKIANNSLEAIGIILNKPKNKEHAEIGVDGICKFRAGAAVAVGARMQVTTSGYFITGNSGFYDVGRALVAVTSGSIGTGLFHFGNPQYRLSSL